MSIRPYKILGKHVKHCIAAEQENNGYWDNCWSPYPEETYPGSKIGSRNRGSTVWAVFVCNNVNCNCKLVINMDEAINNALQEPHDKHGD